MNKVFVVTEGSYSDYKIMGVFDSKEKAELFVSSFYGDIEEYEINPYDEQLSNGYKSYEVHMDRNGSTEEYGVGCGNGKPNDNYFADNYADNKIHMVANMWAKDEKHAIKIANERRAEYLANNSWGIPIEAHLNRGEQI